MQEPNGSCKRFCRQSNNKIDGRFVFRRCRVSRSIYPVTFFTGTGITNAVTGIHSSPKPHFSPHVVSCAERKRIIVHAILVMACCPMLFSGQSGVSLIARPEGIHPFSMDSFRGHGADTRRLVLSDGIASSLGISVFGCKRPRGENFAPHYICRKKSDGLPLHGQRGECFYRW